MVIRIILCALSVGSGFYIGHSMSQGYVRRERYFRDLMMFCSEFKSEVGFSQRKLTQILSAKASDSGKEFAASLNQFVHALESGSEDAQNAILAPCLSDEERQLVRQFFSHLGKSDARAQDEVVQSFHHFLGQKYQAAHDLKAKYKGMHTKLGVLAGLLLAVLII